MKEYKEGDAVACGMCRRDTTVTIVTEREGGTAYDLKCWHRNAICPTCGDLARDKSEVVQKIEPHCDKCDGPFYDDEDE